MARGVKAVSKITLPDAPIWEKELVSTEVKVPAAEVVAEKQDPIPSPEEAECFLANLRLLCDRHQLGYSNVCRAAGCNDGTLGFAARPNSSEFARQSLHKIARIFGLTFEQLRDVSEENFATVNATFEKHIIPSMVRWNAVEKRGKIGK